MKNTLTAQEIRTSINGHFGNIIADAQLNDAGTTISLYAYPRSVNKFKEALKDHVRSGMKLVSLDYPNKTPFSNPTKIVAVLSLV